LLAFLPGKKTKPGLTGICVQADGVALVHAIHNPGARPRITLCEFHSWDGAEPTTTLARLANDRGLKNYRCTTILNSDEYTLLLTEAPDVPAEELKAAMRWRVKDLIDFHINDATLDVFDVPSERSPGKTRPVYAVVARNGAIKQRVDACHDAGIQLEVIDIPELAQRNVAALLPEDAGGMLMLSFRGASGLITVTRQGNLYFARSLDVGVDTLTTSNDSRQWFERIALEIQRSLDYYDSHFREAPLTTLVLAPLPAAVPGLVEFLNANLGIRVQLMAFDSVLDFEAKVTDALAARCFLTIGSALRYEQKAF